MSEAAFDPERATPETVRVSFGSAAVLRLETWQVEVAPTTAYLMVGSKCANDCAFCAQARSSTARADSLSRVSWPAYPATDVVQRLAEAFAGAAIQRACLQVTAGSDATAQTRQMVRAIRTASPVPICVSIRFTDLALCDELLALGAERVTLAMDAACERVYRRIKGHDWHRALDLLISAAHHYPGRVGTHVIIGLGETEAEAASFLQRMHDAGITTALFAFTPVPGTTLAGEPQPPLASYRRLQVARHLIVGGHARAGQFHFSSEGQITSYGVDIATLKVLLQTGQAFQTSGCPGCNRPYYNERPAGPLYNYPRPLHPEETAEAVDMVEGSLTNNEHKVH